MDEFGKQVRKNDTSRCFRFTETVGWPFLVTVHWMLSMIFAQNTTRRSRCSRVFPCAAISRGGTYNRIVHGAVEQFLWISTLGGMVRMQQQPGYFGCFLGE